MVCTQADREDCCFVPSPPTSAPSGVSVGPDITEHLPRCFLTLLSRAAPFAPQIRQGKSDKSTRLSFPELGFLVNPRFPTLNLLFADAALRCAGAGWKGSQGPGLSAGSRRCCSSSASALAPPGCRKNARHEAGRGEDPSKKCVYYFFFPSFPTMGNVRVHFLLFPCTLAQSASFPTQVAGAGKVMLCTRAHQGSVLSSLDTEHGFFLTNTKTSSSSPFSNSFRSAFLPSSLLRTATCDVTTSRS